MAVIPFPPAEFSPLAITAPSPSSLRRPGTSSRTADTPLSPTTSPMNSRRNTTSSRLLLQVLEPGIFFQAQSQVHVLHRRPRGALQKVVQSREEQELPGPGI